LTSSPEGAAFGRAAPVVRLASRSEAEIANGPRVFVTPDHRRRDIVLRIADPGLS
jgi:hypothetical protein